MEGNYHGQTYGVCAPNNVNVTGRWMPEVQGPDQTLPRWVVEANARVLAWAASMQGRLRWAAAHTLGHPAPGSWHYLQCPPENECASGLHHCRLENNEICEDLPVGYRCNCTPGYNRTASYALHK